MKRFFTLLHSDATKILRDQTMVSFLLTPFILVAMVRFLVPIATVRFPQLADYHSLILMFAGIQTSIMFGFITAFVILEEKDENVLQALRVMPISSLSFIMHRLTFATAFSSLGSFFVIMLSGLSHPDLSVLLLLSLQYGLAAPLITLMLATFAKNKIEGMAVFKIVDLILMLPLLSIIFTSNWTNLLAIIPTFWTYHIYALAASGLSPSLSISFITGFSIYFAAITFLGREFSKRVFSTR